MGSNCVPCIEYHVPQARKAGLSEAEISEAIRLSDKVRQVPARKVLEVALQMLTPSPARSDIVQSTTVEAAQTAGPDKLNASPAVTEVAQGATREAAQTAGAGKRCCT